MDAHFLALNIAVVGAAILQSATGIGFGVIAGPILLIALNDGSAIQVSILLNLLIAVLLTPSLWRVADWRLLPKLLAGLAIGSPIGLFVFLNMDIQTLKVFVGLAVMLTLLLTLRSYRKSSTRVRSTAEQVSVGVAGGIMGASLAMPGPVPAAWMSAAGSNNETIRATILVMFVFAYSVALALQSGMAGLSTDTLKLSLQLAPATVAGILLGRVLSNRITERVFRRILTVVLAATVIILFATLF